MVSSYLAMVIIFSQALLPEAVSYFCENSLTGERTYKTYTVERANFDMALPLYDKVNSYSKIKGEWRGDKFIVSRDDYIKKIISACGENEIVRPYGGIFGYRDYEFESEDYYDEFKKSSEVKKKYKSYPSYWETRAW